MNISQGPDTEFAVSYTDTIAHAAVKAAQLNDEDWSEDTRARFIAAYMIAASINLQGAAIAHGLYQVAGGEGHKGSF